MIKRSRQKLIPIGEPSQAPLERRAFVVGEPVKRPSPIPPKPERPMRLLIAKRRNAK